MKKLELTGQTFGRLTVLRELPTRKRGNVVWKCSCSCGGIVEVPSNLLTGGNTKSCGCIRMGLITKHGLHKHPLRLVRNNIIQRCHNENDGGFEGYGGRGIKVCQEWLESYEAFYNWAMENGWKKGLQIDREDNDGDYTPDNCRVVTASVNQGNKRIRKDNKTGYVGVYFRKGAYLWSVSVNGKLTNKYGYITKELAALARNTYITDNNLPNQKNIVF